MSDQKQERLSALIDDELSAAEVDSQVSALYADARLRASWDRYHLIGDALRGEPLDKDVLEVAQKVRERLVEEPTVLAPSRRRPLQRYTLPLAGEALAASVAVMSLVIFPGLYGDVDPVSPRGAGPSALVQYADKPGTRWGIQQPEVESKLNDYLVNHQEYAPTSGMKGILPYAGFVSYEAGR